MRHTSWPRHERQLSCTDFGFICIANRGVQDECTRTFAVDGCVCIKDKTATKKELAQIAKASDFSLSPPPSPPSPPSFPPASPPLPPPPPCEMKAENFFASEWWSCLWDTIESWGLWDTIALLWRHIKHLMAEVYQTIAAIMAGVSAIATAVSEKLYPGSVSGRKEYSDCEEDKGDKPMADQPGSPLTILTSSSSLNSSSYDDSRRPSLKSEPDFVASASPQPEYPVAVQQAAWPLAGWLAMLRQMFTRRCAVM
mmetsp:Transcript_23953/g.56893  ORF Transcript_23953/g.56893 Transcript_23953/m.56893 type:complete len:254 (-) Transcript_23953:187-948(-)